MSYLTDVEWLADARDDARLEADDGREPDMTCGECGTQWWGDWTAYSRMDPREPRNPHCPWCNA